MSIFGLVRDQFIDVIEWVDNTRDTVVHKYPDYGNSIKNGAQLTVREGQLVLFMNEGQFGDMFRPGRHVLTTENIPLLTTLHSWKYGFNSPFKADVYFFNTRLFTALTWGTPTPVTIPDSKFGQVEFRAFGNYNFKITDPKAFFTQLGGTDKDVKLDEVAETFKSKLVDVFSQSVAEMAAQNFSFVQMQAQKPQLVSALLPKIQDYFTTFGVQITDFIIQSITLPDELTEFLRKNTEMNMVGDPNHFMQFQTGVSIEKGAENPGNGGAAVNFGAGMAMGNVLMQSASKMNESQATTAHSVAPASTAEIMNTLKNLADLKKEGIITEEEFNAKKAELLAKI